MIIGDGMGLRQAGLLLSYARQAPHSVIVDRATELDCMMEQGRLGWDNWLLMPCICQRQKINRHRFTD